MFSSHPSVRPLSVNGYFPRRDNSSCSGETCHKYGIHHVSQWAVLKKISRSEVKGKGKGKGKRGFV